MSKLIADYISFYRSHLSKKIISCIDYALSREMIGQHPKRTPNDLFRTEDGHILNLQQADITEQRRLLAFESKIDIISTGF